MQTIKERRKEGKIFRKVTPRSELGVWDVSTDRRDALELVIRQEDTRVPALIPERRKRMLVSPFTFFRGSAILQAHDLAVTPRTGFRVQACGDAHISNFGIFGSPERRLVFDINDFDETLPAPFEVDVKRLAASIEICGRDRGFARHKREAAVYDAVQIYRKKLQECSEMGNMEVWYRHVDVENLIKANARQLDKRHMKKIQGILEKASAKNSERAMLKLMESYEGKLRIKSDPPLIVPVRELGEAERKLFGEENVLKALELYKESLPEDRKRLVEQYEMLELAHKVVGVGSVGRKAWILAMMGRENGDPLVLQVKAAEASVLEPYYGASAYAQCGQRVVEGQRAIQTAGDILLGWVQLKAPDGRRADYYVRQLWDAKWSADLAKITEEEYEALSLLCAATLAFAHAKTGDRHALAGYLGEETTFDEAMVRYASAYADQNEADYELFRKITAENV